MGSIFAGTFVSLDGVMQAPGGPNEDPTNGFEHGGWSAGYWTTPDMMEYTVSQHDRGDALLLGRRTWEIFAAHWPNVPDAEHDPIARKLNTMPKYVVSNTLQRAGWHGSTIVRGGELKARVADLKKRHAETHVVGSAGLLQTLLAEDLVDRFAVWIFPCVLGSGKRLFDRGAVPAGLRLTGSRTFDSGVVVLEYARDGAVRYGSFELDQ